MEHLRIWNLPLTSFGLWLTAGNGNCGKRNRGWGRGAPRWHPGRLRGCPEGTARPPCRGRVQRGVSSHRQAPRVPRELTLPAGRGPSPGSLPRGCNAPPWKGLVRTSLGSGGLRIWLPYFRLLPSVLLQATGPWSLVLPQSCARHVPMPPPPASTASLHTPSGPAEPAQAALRSPSLLRRPFLHHLGVKGHVFSQVDPTGDPMTRPSLLSPG